MLSAQTTRSSERSYALDAAALRGRERLMLALRDRVLAADLRGRTVARAGGARGDGLVDYLLGGAGEPAMPGEVFHRLRWGGMFVFAHPDPDVVGRFAAAFDGRGGFVLERAPTDHWIAPLGLRIPGITRRFWYFAARKTELIEPGDFTDRFTYRVYLQRDEDASEGYRVVKEIPTVQDIYERLRHKHPGTDPELLRTRAMKLVQHVFPTFLTREAAFLQLLQRDLPPAFRSRVPRAVQVEKDAQGFVHRLAMNWMRTGGPVLSQLEFARQAAELLDALHQQAGIMHLDLRLDNMVITPEGVGFVDFGSAVRIGENLQQSQMLSTLFGEMMRTSHIQRLLGRMVEKGQVTSEPLAGVHGKVDKAVDCFYLAVQITKPTGNLEVRQLIHQAPDSPQAQALSSLTAAILRPKGKGGPSYRSAADILDGIRRIESRLERGAA